MKKIVTKWLLDLLELSSLNQFPYASHPQDRIMLKGIIPKLATCHDFNGKPILQPHPHLTMASSREMANLTCKKDLHLLNLNSTSHRKVYCLKRTWKGIKHKRYCASSYGKLILIYKRRKSLPLKYMDLKCYGDVFHWSLDDRQWSRLQAYLCSLMQLTSSQRSAGHWDFVLSQS